MSRRPSHSVYAWALAVLWPLGVSSGHAAEPAERPVLKTNRWQEDWLVSVAEPGPENRPAR